MKNTNSQELTEDVLYKIQKHYDDQGIQLRFSLFALLQWKDYHVKISYYFDNKDYFFFLDFDKENSKIYQFLKPNCFSAFIILAKEFIDQEYIDKLKILTKEKKCSIFLSQELDKSFTDKINAHIIDSYPPRIGNYIYETKNFIEFPGKKMQKKKKLLKWVS